MKAIILTSFLTLALTQVVFAGPATIGEKAEATMPVKSLQRVTTQSPASTGNSQAKGDIFENQGPLVTFEKPPYPEPVKRFVEQRKEGDKVIMIDPGITKPKGKAVDLDNPKNNWFFED